MNGVINKFKIKKKYKKQLPTKMWILHSHKPWGSIKNLSNYYVYSRFTFFKKSVRVFDLYNITENVFRHKMIT